MDVKKLILPEEVPSVVINDPKFREMGIPAYDQGLVQELVSRDANGSTDFNIGLYWLQPGEVHPLHYHATASEFYFVLDGSALFTIDDKEYQLSSNAMIYMPANTNHKIVVNRPQVVKVLYGYNVPAFTETGTVYIE